jgi:hypothetical protein
MRPGVGERMSLFARHEQRGGYRPPISGLVIFWRSLMRMVRMARTSQSGA